MSRYRISREAQIDLGEISDFIAHENPEAAWRILQVIERQFELIASQPKMGVSCDELLTGLRRHVFDSYVLFYQFTENRVVIVRVIHSARDFYKMFETPPKN